MFVRHGAAWSQQAYLKASNTEAADYFGGAVGLWGDTVVVGAWQEDSSAIGVNGDQPNNSADRSGAAYVFTGVGLGPQPNLDIVPACYLIRFNGVPEFSYQLQRSPKVTGLWETIGTVTVPESGFVEYLDSKSPPGQVPPPDGDFGSPRILAFPFGVWISPP